MKVVAFGDNCIDYYPKLNRYYVTGNVVDFAFNMQKLGVPTSVVSVTGNDEYGKRVVEELTRAGLDVSHLRVDRGPTAVCYMELIGKERIHGKYEEGVMQGVTFTPEQVEFAAQHEYVHLAFYGHAEQHLPYLKQNGCMVSFDYSDDLSSDLVKETAAYVDYLFFSYQQRDDFIEEYLREKVARRAKTAVATFGSKGSLAWDGTRFYEGGIVPTQVENTVGAGDSFIAGFMYGVIQGWEMPACLHSGARVASEVVSVFGPWKES
jgi:fructoselysine 6-kinase